MAIEGEIMERGLAVIPPTAGTDALAVMSDEDFERTLASIRKGQERIARMQRELLVPGVDFGNVPGVDKPSLGKPGAEKLGLAYKLPARVERILVIGDGIASPPITYDATCHLHVGTFDGPEVGVGYGTCNSWETKYRWRNQERTCPTCGNAAIIAGKAEYGGGWLCFKKRGGCGAKFGAADPQITGQQVGREDNPEPWDLANTLMKMAEKRAHVDAILRTTAASGIFTQDLEDNVGIIDVTPTPAPQTAPAARPAQRGSNEPPPLTDADVAAMGATMPARSPAESLAKTPTQAAADVAVKRAARVEADELIGEVPTGLSVQVLLTLARSAGVTKAKLADAIAAAGVERPTGEQVNAVAAALTDAERGKVADALNLDWTTP